jgi:SAM-dependent methyltransferase
LTTSSETRFAFGENWAKFLRTVDDRRIAESEASLRALIRERLDGLRLLDVGSGSGLSSLAARRLGADVTSFDYDATAVECTRALRERYAANDPLWRVTQGSILDRAFLSSLGSFDVVYSWGVLHHTGRMWEAIENAASLVGAGGMLVIAIYNDQGRASKMWARVKRAYNMLPAPLRFLVLWPAALGLWGPTILRDSMRLRPLATWRSYVGSRGMSPWRDVVDWVGGYPFEVAKPEQIFDFLEERGFRLVRLTTCGGGHGCNEFTFSRERLT